MDVKNRNRKPYLIEDLTPPFNEFSLTFDGVDEYLMSSASFDMSFERNETDLTISVWFKPNSLHQGTVLSRSSSINNRGWFILPRADGKVRVGLVTGTNSSRLIIHTTDSYNVGQWNHFVFTYNSNLGVNQNGAELYLNGVQQVKDVISDQLYNSILAATTEARATIGGLRADAGSPIALFDGLVDEVAFYNTNLATPAQVTEIWNGGVANDLNSTTLGQPEFYIRCGDNASWGGSSYSVPNEGIIDNGDWNTFNMEQSDRTTDVPE